MYIYVQYELLLNFTTYCVHFYDWETCSNTAMFSDYFVFVRVSSFSVIWKVNSVNETAIDLSWNTYKSSSTYKVTVNGTEQSEKVCVNNRNSTKFLVYTWSMIIIIRDRYFI